MGGLHIGGRIIILRHTKTTSLPPSLPLFLKKLSHKNNSSYVFKSRVFLRQLLDKLQYNSHLLFIVTSAVTYTIHQLSHSAAELGYSRADQDE